MKRMIVALALVASPAIARAEPDGLRVRAMGAWKELRNQKLREKLVLDDPTAKRLFDVLDRYDGEQARIHGEMRSAVGAVRDALQAGRTDAEMTALLDRVVDLRERVTKLQIDRIHDVRKVLTPTQQARLVMLLPRIERRMRRMIEEAEGPPPGDKGDDF